MMELEVVDAQIVRNRLKQVLAAKQLAQEEVARRIGVSYRHFNRIVLGQSEPTLLMAARIAAVLETPIDQLFQMKVKTRARKRPSRPKAEEAQPAMAAQEGWT